MIIYAVIIAVPVCLIIDANDVETVLIAVLSSLIGGILSAFYPSNNEKVC